MRTRVVRHLVLAALVLPLGAAPGEVRAADVTEVLTRMQRAVAPGKDLRAKVEFELTNAKGESVYWTGRYYRRGGEDARARLVFDTPLDLRGTEVAVQRGADGESRTRIYLPWLRRVRSIEGDMRGESFLGTDFNYEDLGFQQLEYQQHTLLSGDAAKSRDCHWLESVPERGWWYGKLLRCIDRKTYLPRRTEYYDRGGTLWKVRTFEGVKTISSFPTATEITMRTVPAGTTTRVTLTDVEYDVGLPDSLFESP